MHTRLSVNLNAIAMLRNRRDLPWPDMLGLARLALRGGAGGITVHPRPDERHIRFKDLEVLSCFLRREFPKAIFNIEGYPSEHFLSLASLYAQQITLVPDKPEQKTSDHGWDFAKDAGFLTPIIAVLKEKNIRVSVFANPSSEGLELAKRIGADAVEFYTGPYAQALCDESKIQKTLAALKNAAATAQSLGLSVHAGHDLTVKNLTRLKKEIPYLKEVSIGHSLTCDALHYGLELSVQRFLHALQPGVAASKP